MEEKIKLFDILDSKIPVCQAVIRFSGLQALIPMCLHTPGYRYG